MWHLVPADGQPRLVKTCTERSSQIGCRQAASLLHDGYTPAGLADPVSDLRNAFICKGGATAATLTNVTFKALGCYVWEDADAVLTGCRFDGGMHGLYAWGRCQVQLASCDITATEKSGICVRDGVTLSAQVCIAPPLCVRSLDCRSFGQPTESCQ